METQMEKVVRLAIEMGEQYRENMREYLEGMPYNVKKATAEQDEAFVRLMIKQYPPEWIERPDGGVEFNSPWIIALRDGVVEAKGAWAGVKAALERIGPLPLPEAPVGPPVAVPPVMGPPVMPPPMEVM